MNDSIIATYQNCHVCPRDCGVNRYQQRGYCQAGAQLQMSLGQLHFGEEPFITGTRGSGTIFFSWCNLRCVFCQNFEISDEGFGVIYSLEALVQNMLQLQNLGAHNINLVTPAHFTPHLKQAIIAARQQGLQIPVVWNTNAYEHVSVLAGLEGLVDIYMPDLKYASALFSARYSGARDYPYVARKAILEMFRQVGHLQIKNGIAQKGLFIRLLVLPNQLAGIRESLYWIHENLGPETYISLMGQYYPTHKAKDISALNRGITQFEYEELISLVQDLGFENCLIQEIGSSADWTPIFKS
jgi:putative pyruvate formate lyase activating enzyme